MSRLTPLQATMRATIEHLDGDFLGSVYFKDGYLEASVMTSDAIDPAIREILNAAIGECITQVDERLRKYAAERELDYARIDDTSLPREIP